MICIYARQSIEKKESLSISDQVDICKNQASIIQKQLNEEHEVVVFKESKSGKNTIGRPEFLKLMKEVSNGNVKAIIVYKLDRISRDLLDFCSIWEELKRHNVQFISCNEQFDTSTPMGEAMLMIAMVFAQMERNSIIERVTDNYFSRAEKGFYLGGYAPIGYDKIPIEHMGKKTSGFKINEERAELVKTIYKEYTSTDISLGKLAEKFTNEGMKTNRDSFFTGIALSRVLRNPAYVRADAKVYEYLSQKGATINNDIKEFIGINGCYICARQIEHTQEELRERSFAKKKSGRSVGNISNASITLAPHEGFIESELWLKCQYKLDNNKQVKCGNAGTHSWLTGIMRCGNCGYGVTVVNNNRGRNYINCYGRKMHICKGREKAWELYEIEDVVENELLNRLQELENVQAKELIEIKNPQIDKMRNEVSKLEVRISSLLDEVEIAKEQNYCSSIDVYRKRIQDLSTEIHTKNDSINKMLNDDNTRKNTMSDGMDIKGILKNWKNIDMKIKRKIAKAFIQHVVINDHDIYTIFY